MKRPCALSVYALLTILFICNFSLGSILTSSVSLYDDLAVSTDILPTNINFSTARLDGPKDFYCKADLFSFALNDNNDIDSNDITDTSNLPARTEQFTDLGLGKALKKLFRETGLIMPTISP